MYSQPDPAECVFDLTTRSRNLILYIDRQSGAEGQRLHQALCNVPEDTSLEMCTDLYTLIKRLRKCTQYVDVDVDVDVFLADTVERLANLYTLLSYLEDKKIVLILPNNEQSTYTLGLLIAFSISDLQFSIFKTKNMTWPLSEL